MNRIVVDSYAWMEYFKSSDKGLKAKEKIDDISNEIFIPQIVISEVVSSIKRQGLDPQEAVNIISGISNVMELTRDDCVQVGMLHAEMRKTIKDFGLGDSFVLFSARKLNAKILTGDPHFKNIKEAILI